MVSTHSKVRRQRKPILPSLKRRAVDLRQDAWHELASELVATYSDVVIEDLDIAAMKRSMNDERIAGLFLTHPLGSTPRWSATRPKDPE